MPHTVQSLASDPLGAIYRLHGEVLLLGCGHDANTSLHLAEWRQKSPPRGVTGSSIRQSDGTSRWTTWIDVIEAEDDFEQLAQHLRPPESCQAVAPPTWPIDFTTAWMAGHRPVA